MSDTIIRKLVLRPKEKDMFIKVFSKIGGHEFLEFQQLIPFDKLEFKKGGSIWAYKNNDVFMFINTGNYDFIIVDHTRHNILLTRLLNEV
jgi:hypothetical protein